MEMEEILEKVYKASIKLLVPATIDETYKSIVDEAVKLVGGKYGSIFLEKEGALTRIYTTYPDLYKIKIRKNGLTYKVFNTNEPIVENISNISRVHPLMSKTGAKSDILIPLSYQNKAIGVLTILSNSTQEFTFRDLIILKMFGPLATLAIIKTQYYEETRMALETRDLFISMASHELKTPLTTVYAYMQLMQKKMESGETLKTTWVNTLLKETKRLTDLVNELLQVNQIQKGTLQFQMKKVNVVSVVKDAVNDFMITNPDRVVKINNKIQNGKSSVLGDSNKIFQVIINLLNNAAKHSNKQSVIAVFLDRKENNLMIRIRDQGTGIPKKDLPKLFDQFYRGNNHNKEGMGLGLYLTKRIVDEHEGSIYIASKVKKGTTVKIILPTP